MKKNSCSISCIEKMCRFIFLSAQFTHKNTLLFYYAHKVDIVFFVIRIMCIVRGRRAVVR